MNVARSSLVLSVFVLLASVGATNAADNDYRQVWRDSEGVIVRNSTGTCVRSQWITDEDACNGAAEPRHAFITQQERTVYFAFNRADISEESKARLDSLAPRLTSDEDVRGAEIVGYADRIGTVSYNEALSKKRADAVRNYLVSKGFVKPSKTKTEWVGKSQPSATCAEDLNRPQLIACLQPDRKATVEVDYLTKSGTDEPAGSEE